MFICDFFSNFARNFTIAYNNIKNLLNPILGMKRLYTIMVMAIFACSLSFAEVYCLNIAQKGSKKVTLTIPFSKNPVVSYAVSGGSQTLVITTSDESTESIVLNKNYSISYTIDDTPTTIKEAISASDMKYDGNMVVISGAKPYESVCVYGANGAMLTKVQTNADGVSTIDLSMLPSGVVIIKTSNTSFKLIK